MDESEPDGSNYGDEGGYDSTLDSYLLKDSNFLVSCLMVFATNLLIGGNTLSPFINPAAIVGIIPEFLTI